MGARGPQPGDVVDGRYRLELLVGTGGMGAVWSARVPGTRESVAVKFLHAQIATDPIIVQRFLLEARAGSTIAHPNVIRVLGSGTLEGGADPVPYLVMELLSGKTLTDVLRARPRLDVADAVMLVVEITRGAIAAHEAGIVHRDLKPANVFLHAPSEGEVVPKILDFGISKFTDPGLDGGLTTTGMVIGSTTYMSPEQAVGSRDVDVRTDVWSLGVLLYRLLTSESPLPANAQDAMVALAGSEELPLAALASPRVPASLAAVVTRCLRKKPDARWPTAAALEEALRDVIVREKLDGTLARLLDPPSSSATIASAKPVSLGEAGTERDGPTLPTERVSEPSAHAAEIDAGASEGPRRSVRASEASERVGSPWFLIAGIAAAIVLLASSVIVASRISARGERESASVIVGAPPSSEAREDPSATPPAETTSAHEITSAEGAPSSAPRSRARFGRPRAGTPPPKLSSAPPPPSVEPWRKPGF